MANEDGNDGLDAAELTKWVEEGDGSYQFVQQLMLSTLYVRKHDRTRLVGYLEDHHTRARAAYDGTREDSDSLLAILKNRIGDVLYDRPAP